MQQNCPAHRQSAADDGLQLGSNMEQSLVLSTLEIKLNPICVFLSGGGLLACVPTAQASGCVQALHAAGFSAATVIGHVEAPIADKAAPTISIRMRTPIQP